MKKAKVILSAVALFAVVGGALAFKAARISVRYFTPGVNNVCSVPLDIRYTTNPEDATGPLTTFYTSITTIQSAPCVPLTLYQIN
ncbi:hypothetical protein [Chitinophaga tropicalis]|uniref:Uncharacterized protein n=1 Tax=Chitinophaga tropicalis TaxID=2683588 RepID=A0A7K1UDS7_9BACT|nr:hypothetical protein [Chitinophaga tropicalis]MVT12493.1 hypothetical protein [Chitinophaga tropicalis]